MRHHIDRAHTAAIAAAGLALLAFSFALTAAPSAHAETCPNEARREEQGAIGLALPDCRAYELVSPLGLEPQVDRGTIGEVNGYQASGAGGRVAFYARPGAPDGSPSYGFFYLASRGERGWSSEDVIPPQSTASLTFCYPFVWYSPDLSRLVLEDGLGWGEGFPNYPDSKGAHNCSHDEPALVEGEPRGAQNLFVRENENASYRLVNVTPSGLPPRDAWYQAGSTDFSHLVFTDPNLLTPEAPVLPEVAPDAENNGVAEDLYEWADGTVHLVTIVPGGEAVWGLLANGSESASIPSSAPWTNAVSSDGERVFFRAGGTVGSPGSNEEPKESYVGGDLYLRENATQPRGEECAGPGKACTVQLDAAQGGPESGDGHFQWASSDGSRAFFTDERRLVGGAGAEPGKPDLYEYDLERPEGSRLLDLTAGTLEAADVLGLSGVSADGSEVYFVATGDLSGAQQNSQGSEAISGKPNLYLYRFGTTTFIATLDAKGEDAQTTSNEDDTCDWRSFTFTGELDPQTGTAANCMSARVTPSGAFLAFTSKRSLTDYDNVVPGSGLRSHEIFLYEADRGPHGTLVCASCDPRGLPPTGDPSAREDPHILPPMQVHTNATIGFTYLTRNLTDDGRVIFDTSSRLLPADQNDQSDVYEFSGGTLSLISDGHGSAESRFEDASADGTDVFFITTQSLLPGDTDNTRNLYDARIGGGFPEPPQPPVCESQEGCHNALQQPPGSVSSGSSRFQGPEEDASHLVCPKGQVQRKGSCAIKHKKKHRKAGKHHQSKKHHKAKKGHEKRSARVDRRAAK
jgi:hypothetical protein